MDEARFVIKCFLFAALLLMFSQLKIKDGTVETEVQAALVSSQTAHFVNKIAEGGVKAVRDLAGLVKSKMSTANNSDKSPAIDKAAISDKVAGLDKINMQTIQDSANAAQTVIGAKLEAVKVDTKAALKNLDSKVKSQADASEDDEVEEIQ